MQNIYMTQNWIQNPVLELGDTHTDTRGSIKSLLSFIQPTVGSIVIIDSKKDTIRANHYHKTDWHYCYVLSGQIHYYARAVESKEDPVKTIINTHQLFYTPPLTEHAMYFPGDSSFITFGGGTRRQEDYEADLVRVQLI